MSELGFPEVMSTVSWASSTAMPVKWGRVSVVGSALEGAAATPSVAATTAVAVSTAVEARRTDTFPSRSDGPLDRREDASPCSRQGVDDSGNPGELRRGARAPMPQETNFRYIHVEFLAAFLVSPPHIVRTRSRSRGFQDRSKYT